MIEVVRFTVAGEAVSLPGAIVAGATRTTKWTVVYDGYCRVCRRLASSLAALDKDRRFEIVPSQHPGVRARFPWIPPRAYDTSLQLISRNGHTIQGAAAIERILDEIPRGRALSWAFRIPGARFVADRFYKWFARHRRHLGCGSHCAFRPEETDFPS